MFEQKQKQLVDIPTTATSGQSTNKFISAGMQKSAETTSGNGALKYENTNDDFVTQFFQAGNFLAPRSFRDISRDQSVLHSTDELKAIKFAFYLRLISRTPQLMNGFKASDPHIGAELKHEAIMRLIWTQVNNPDTFWKNAWLIPAVGSWKDIFKMLSLDLQYHGWKNKKLDWGRYGQLIKQGLVSSNTVDLLKKYLPQLKAKSQLSSLESQANNQIAKWLVNLLYGELDTKNLTTEQVNLAKAKRYRQYRKLKSSGKAHSWQQLISQQKYDELEFDKIHGRALRTLVRSKFLKNHDLVDKYNQWLGAPSTKTVKYTGFVHELFVDYPQNSRGNTPESYVTGTVDKQFTELVTKTKNEAKVTKFIVVRDTSSSMTSTAEGTNMSSFAVAKALALFFSEFLEGAFANTFIEFNTSAKMHQWKGKTPTEKWMNDRTSYVGSTNIQSVFDLFVRLKREGTPESDFPEGMICISDGEFNRAYSSASDRDTNYNVGIQKMRSAGFSEEYLKKFTVVLWDIPNSYYSRGISTKFESYDMTKGGILYVGGYSGSLVSLLTGEELVTPSQLVDKALNQEILNLIEI